MLGVGLDSRNVDSSFCENRTFFRPTEAVKDLKIAEFGVENAKEYVEGAECLPMEVERSSENEVAILD